MLCVSGGGGSDVQASVHTVKDARRSLINSVLSKGVCVCLMLQQ